MNSLKFAPLQGWKSPQLLPDATEGAVYLFPSAFCYIWQTDPIAIELEEYIQASAGLKVER